MKVSWDSAKNDLLKRTRGIGFIDALEMFKRQYVVQEKNDNPESHIPAKNEFVFLIRISQHTRMKLLSSLNLVGIET
jgi:hypothetical protein